MEDQALGIKSHFVGYLKLTEEQKTQMGKMTGHKPTALAVVMHESEGQPPAISVDMACW